MTTDAGTTEATPTDRAEVGTLTAQEILNLRRLHTPFQSVSDGQWYCAECRTTEGECVSAPCIAAYLFAIIGEQSAALTAARAERDAALGEVDRLRKSARDVIRVDAFEETTHDDWQGAMARLFTNLQPFNPWDEPGEYADRMLTPHPHSG